MVLAKGLKRNQTTSLRPCENKMTRARPCLWHATPWQRHCVKPEICLKALPDFHLAKNIRIRGCQNTLETAGSCLAQTGLRWPPSRITRAHSWTCHLREARYSTRRINSTPRSRVTLATIRRNLGSDRQNFEADRFWDLLNSTQYSDGF